MLNFRYFCCGFPFDTMAVKHLWSKLIGRISAITQLSSASVNSIVEMWIFQFTKKILLCRQTYTFIISQNTKRRINARKVLICVPNRIDCYTVLAWWQKDCQLGLKHGLQLAKITLLWLIGLKVDWDYPVPHCIMGSRDKWEFQLFFGPQWQSLCIDLTAGNCLS